MAKGTNNNSGSGSSASGSASSKAKRTKLTTSSRDASSVANVPKTLRGHIFYGLNLDEDQIRFGDMILDENIKAVFCNAKSGSGKTTIAVATAVMLVEYGLYDMIVYCMHSVGDAQGFLPGTISEKSEVWFEGLYQALVTANQNPQQVILDASLSGMNNLKTGTGFVKAVTDTYLRGSTVGGDRRTIFIVDEAQNFDIHSLRKTLTRATDDSKVIVIGHDGQIDLPNHGASGFIPCMEHFRAKDDPRFGFCELTVNHRGLVSRTADENWDLLTDYRRGFYPGNGPEDIDKMIILGM